MEQLKTTPQDWFNHIARGITSNALIQYVIKLDEKINYQLLSKSVFLSFRAEPVLGCIFVEKDPTPIWSPFSDKMHNDACCQINTQNMEDEINIVLAMDINASKQLPIQVFLIDDTKSNVLVIKISHSACDGAGSKYYLELLASIYTHLEENNSFIPQSNTMDRNTESLYKALNINDTESYFNPQKAELISSWGFPTEKEIITPQTFSYRLLRISNNEYKKIKQYTKDQGVTINSFLVAVYFLALTEISEIMEDRKELQFMVDLRKYLPGEIKKTICNFSAILNVELPIQRCRFSEMLKYVDKSIKSVLASDSIIHGTIAGDLAEKSGYSALKDFFTIDWDNIKKTGNCTPMISNLGLFSPENIKLGKIQVKDMYLISPAFYAPAFMLGVSSYNNIMTICASYYNPGINHNTINALLDRIDYEIKKAITNRETH